MHQLKISASPYPLSPGRAYNHTGEPSWQTSFWFETELGATSFAGNFVLVEQLAADFVDSDSDAELQQVDLNCGGSTFTTLVDDDVVQDGRQRHRWRAWLSCAQHIQISQVHADQGPLLLHGGP